jgi:hypothetical protein
LGHGYGHFFFSANRVKPFEKWKESNAGKEGRKEEGREGDQISALIPLQSAIAASVCSLYQENGSSLKAIDPLFLLQ